MSLGYIGSKRDDTLGIGTGVFPLFLTHENQRHLVQSFRILFDCDRLFVKRLGRIGMTGQDFCAGAFIQKCPVCKKFRGRGVDVALTGG